MLVRDADDERAGVIATLRSAGCVFAEEEADLLLAAAREPAARASMIARRVRGEPLEVILGWVEFASARVRVAAGVFVPRRRTELLVQEAIPLVRPGQVVVDLCCGCGAIGHALARAVPGIVLHAVDVEPGAVRCARANLAGLGQVHAGDLYAGLPGQLRGEVMLLTANAPYVPSDQLALLPREARDHEPSVALHGGPDGLRWHRRIAAQAAQWLAPGGHLLVETSRDLAAGTLAAMAAGGLVGRVEHDPDRGASVAVGRRG